MSHGYSGVVKDPLDLRDLLFEGTLVELPRSVDHRERVPYFLDQGEEGACTGFGLAAVVNFLISSRDDWPALGDSVSPWMLYYLARRYDEWEGEQDEGSSIRGAMKGWMRHGVCAWELWPDDDAVPTPENALEALERPLGNYFRVRHLHLNQMHAALAEVGVLLASANVHAGWEKVPARGKPRIPFERGSIGGHAFAIVGYDDEGFWIQNSWGDGWGAGGFAHLSYDDWLENSWDCWVAQLGVPKGLVTAGAAGPADRASKFDYITDEAVVNERIRGHVVSLGNDGRLKQHGRLATPQAAVEAIFRARIPAEAARTGKPPRVLLYAHGGLTSAKASARRTATLAPTFEANGIYPVHFMWRTGALDTIGNILGEAIRGRKTRGVIDDLAGRFTHLLDEALELAARPLGRSLWAEMKENARLATEAADGGGRLVAAELAALAARDPRLEVHLAGHSAGSILLAHLIPELVRLGVPMGSLTLFAPACTTELFKDKIHDEIGSSIAQLALFNLSDEAERDDSVGPYRKSILYLISEALEERKQSPLLGMDKFVAKDAKIRRLFTASSASGPSGPKGPTVIRRVALASRTLASDSEGHLGFDNDEDSLDSLMRIALGRNTLDRRF